jgi:hypothetical protein
MITDDTIAYRTARHVSEGPAAYENGGMMRS